MKQPKSDIITCETTLLQIISLQVSHKRIQDLNSSHSFLRKRQNINMFQRLVALMFITAVISEPECSKFHYEEQTLNKMIRQEIAMEKLQADMAAIQQQVLDALGKLTETTQQLKDDWNYEKTNLKHVTNELMREANKSVRNFAAEMEKLKGKTT
jgi:hypothetical protein